MPTYSHILVTHNYEAEDLLRLLKQGRDFAELAKKFSKCPSATSGGDLGDIPLAKTQEDFEDAAKRLKPGEVSPRPVRTSAGYHLILRTS
jgi:peptidylprolyl isomerase/peptidyl-prolyl cis-trans isomerase C